MVIGKKSGLKVQIGGTIRAGKPCAADLERTMSQQWTQQEIGPPPTMAAAVAKAIFIPQPNSLPFEERCVSLENSVKIGRNVNRLVPSPTNPIFECRVLSRHHATLWYENGHFYIMDNQSSNGTFINKSKTSITKDMGPQEVFSGDVVQFGIAVSENHDDENVKNLFLPVVAMLKLYHANGDEAKTTLNSSIVAPLQLTDIYQLNHYVQEAVQREAILESKLNMLRERLEMTRAGAHTAWRSLVGENALIVRLNALESTRKTLEAQMEDKQAYQIAAQDSLQRAHEYRLEIEDQVERNAREAEALRHHNRALKNATERATAELQKLASACERRLAAAREAVAAAERREAAMAKQLLKLQGSYQNQLVANDLVNAKDTLYELFSQRYESDQNDVTNQVINKDGVEKEIDPDSTNEEEKKIRLSNESEINKDAKDLKDESSGSPDDNANSYRNTGNEFQVTKNQQEFINSVTLIATLNREMAHLRERLEIVEADNTRLHALRDQILAQPCDGVEQIGRNNVDSEIAEPLLNVLQENLKEKKNLENLVEDLKQKLELANEELAKRPSVEDYSDLNETLQTLSRFTTPRERVDVAVSTNIDLEEIEDKNSNVFKDVEDDIETDLDEIDKMFREATESHDPGNDVLSDEEEIDEAIVRESLTAIHEKRPDSTITLVPDDSNEFVTYFKSNEFDDPSYEIKPTLNETGFDRNESETTKCENIQFLEECGQQNESEKIEGENTPFLEECGLTSTETKPTTNETCPNEAEPSQGDESFELDEPDEMAVLNLLDSVIAESASDLDDTQLSLNEDSQLHEINVPQTIDAREEFEAGPCSSESLRFEIEVENSVESIYSNKDISSLSYNDETELVERFENGSVCSLQEELVKAKEGWASAVAEKAMLELELSRVRSDLNLKGNDNQMIVYVMPIAAAVFYIVFYYFVS